MTDADAKNRTDALLRAIESISVSARWRIPQPLTPDFVARSITRGDEKLARIALEALRQAGVLAVVEINGESVYRLAE